MGQDHNERTQKKENSNKKYQNIVSTKTQHASGAIYMLPSDRKNGVSLIEIYNTTVAAKLYETVQNARYGGGSIHRALEDSFNAKVRV